MKKIKYWIAILFLVQNLLGLTNITTVSAATPTASIKMVEPKVTIYVGATKVLKLKLTKVDAKKIKWQSSQPTVVSVDSKGQIKGLKSGTSNITAYVPNTKLKATATITVNKKALNASGIFQKVNPSVVYIESYNKYKQKIGTGSGVILSKDGLVVTNHHVVVDVSEVSYVKIKLANGQVYQTNKVVGYDADRDLTILKINSPKNLVPIELGDSDKVKTGEKTFALGSPLGIQNSVTEGIISNKAIIDYDQTFIQHTAPISPGNSGGALVNIYGELIGINVAYYAQGQNMNLAIPVKAVKNLDKTMVNRTLLDMNQDYFVPVMGQGVTEEIEENDDLDTANEIIHAEGDIVGQLKNADDMDVFYFLVTDYSALSLVGTTVDPALGEDFGISLYDIDGKLVQNGEIYFDENLNRYLCDLYTELNPGYYHIAVYALDNTKLPYNNTDYLVRYTIENVSKQ
ncbi:trypsin-like peptidase domain-containing protein [Pseudoneobacillus sp. C159]